MNNYISINGQRIELTQEQVDQIVAAQGTASAELSSFSEGDTVKIGGHEMVILEQTGDSTALIRKELLPDMQFGQSNHYDGSCVDEACNEFAGEIAAAVGEDNMLPFSVDLTTDDGLKDYGHIERRAALLTAEQYRRYVEVLDQHKPDAWWWLATANSTKKHENDRWVKCVAPSGYISGGNCDDNGGGVRPFCILKSNIFVSV